MIMELPLLACVAGVAVTSVSATLTATPTSAPTGSLTYFVNPLDSRLLSVTSEHDTTTVSGLRDVNGLPVGVYAMQHYSSADDATDDVLSQYAASVVTTFEEAAHDNTTTLRVDRAVVEGVTFDFHYTPLNNDTMMSVRVASRFGTFKFNAAGSDLIPAPKLSDLGGDLLPVPTVARDFDALASEPLHDLSPYLNATAASVLTHYADASGSPVLDGDVVFVVEEEDDDKKTLLAARHEQRGYYGATLPFYPAPVSLPGWLELITTGTDLEFDYACQVLDAYDDVSGVVCDNVALRLANETSDEALDVVRVCPVLFASWARSCESSSGHDVKFEDSANAAASTVTPYGRTLNEPNSTSFTPGAPILIPEGIALNGSSFFQQIPLQTSPTAATSSETPTNEMTAGAVMVCDGDLCECQAPGGNVCAVTDPDPNRDRAPNGCGAAGGANVDNLIPRGFRSGFISSCFAHDECYSACGVSRSQCDAVFLSDMNDACDDIFSIFRLGEYLTCLSFAQAFHLAVRVGGAGPYESGQMEFCTCETCT